MLQSPTTRTLRSASKRPRPAEEPSTSAQPGASSQPGAAVAPRKRSRPSPSSQPGAAAAPRKRRRVTPRTTIARRPPPPILEWLPAAVLEHVLSFCDSSTLLCASLAAPAVAAAVPAAAAIRAEQHLCLPLEVDGAPPFGRAQVLAGLRAAEGHLALSSRLGDACALVLQGKMIQARDFFLSNWPASFLSMHLSDDAFSSPFVHSFLSDTLLKAFKRLPQELVGRHLDAHLRPFLSYPDAWAVRCRALEIFEIAAAADIAPHAAAVEAQLDNASGLCRAAAVRVLGRLGPDYLHARVETLLLPRLADVNTIVNEAASREVAALPNRMEILNRARDVLPAHKFALMQRAVSAWSAHGGASNRDVGLASA